MMKRNRLRRSISEPLTVPCSTGICRMSSSSLSRERKRITIVNFEKGRDIVAVWMNEWSSDEVCGVLHELVKQCNLHQMEFLWTSLESIPHNDFLHQALKNFPSIPFQPLSTPISREVKSRLQRSKYKENKLLHRVQSMYITNSSCTSPAVTTLPDLPSSSIENVSIQVISPRRRHMTVSLTKPVSPSCFLHSLQDAWSPQSNSQHDRIRRKSKTAMQNSKQFPMPFEGLSFLTWFSSLEKDWQQQEILQLVIWTLNEKELYCLAIVLLSRQYKDFISDLPLFLVQNILLHLPGKDILTACTVSKVWYNRCTDDALWERKCGQIKLGVMHSSQQTWRQLFIDNIKLSRNWRLGKSKMLSCAKQTDRILCVCINTEESLCASGSNDHTIKVWRLTNGRLLNTIQEHARVWSLTFYGLNLLISGCSDNWVKIWNARTGKCLKILEGHTGTIWALKRKGEILITGSHDKTAIIWNIRQCKYKRHLIGHSGAVFDVDINNDCTLAFTCSGDKTIRVWTIDSGICNQIIPSANCQSIQSIHYNQSLIAYSSGTDIYIWSLTSNKLLQTFKGHEKRVESIHFQTDGSNANTIVSCGRDGFIKYWNTDTGNCIRTLGYQSAPINSIDRDSTKIVSVTDNGILSILDFNPIRSLLYNSPSVSGPDSATISKNEAKANLMISQHRSLLKHKQKMMLLNTKH